MKEIENGQKEITTREQTIGIFQSREESRNFSDTEKTNI